MCVEEVLEDLSWSHIFAVKKNFQVFAQIILVIILPVIIGQENFLLPVSFSQL